MIETVTGLVAKTLPQPLRRPRPIVATSLANRVTVLQSMESMTSLISATIRTLSSQRQKLHFLSGDGTQRDKRESRWNILDGRMVHERSRFYIVSQLPNVTGELNIGSVMIDSQRNLVYAQMGEVGSTVPVLQVADADNLTVRERLLLPRTCQARASFRVMDQQCIRSRKAE